MGMGKPVDTLRGRLVEMTDYGQHLRGTCSPQSLENLLRETRFPTLPQALLLTGDKGATRIYISIEKNDK